MAKRRKQKSPARRHRRRSMGAMSPQVENIVYGVAGAIAGGLVTGFIPDLISSTMVADVTKNAQYNKSVKAAIVAVAGYMLATKGKSPMMKALGDGMVIGAGAKIVSTLTGIGGIGDVPMIAAFNRMKVAGLPPVQQKTSLPSSSPNLMRNYGVGTVSQMVGGIRNRTNR